MCVTARRARELGPKRLRGEMQAQLAVIPVLMEGLGANVQRETVERLGAGRPEAAVLIREMGLKVPVVIPGAWRGRKRKNL